MEMNHYKDQKGNSMEPDDPSPKAYIGYEGIDELKDEMEKIKISVVATIIMEMTRFLPQKKRQTLENFCSQIILNKYQSDLDNNEVMLKKLSDYNSKNIDLLVIKKVNNL